ncbi:MAG TPA: FAD-dependent thymidylate synthase [Bacteroidetes bacterium]|nr:FAD-dependent thymidylate synthase [Bacteroidota bacterium]
MPQDKTLKPITLPMKLKFGLEPATIFYNNLRALEVELVDHPTREQAHNVAWQYVKATWADDADDTTPHQYIPKKELSSNLEDVLNFRALPTPMECLGFTFKLSGLSFQEVTHIIRHRAGSFAAQCTGDRDLRDDPAVIPESVENSPEFLARWTRLVRDSKQLYVDMTDSKDVSMMDARMILPKCMTSFYLMRLNLKDLLGFIAQRQDMQIQPAADNLLAVYMARELIRVLPEASTRVSFNKPDMHYVKTFRVPDGNGGWTSRGTNLYWPEPKNDLFDYHPDDSIYQARREEINGTENPGGETHFTKLWNSAVSDIEEMVEEYNSSMER